jgi:ABC-type lipoprotein release transport system permease subunit
LGSKLQIRNSSFNQNYPGIVIASRQAKEFGAEKGDELNLATAEEFFRK